MVAVTRNAGEFSRSTPGNSDKPCGTGSHSLKWLRFPSQQVGQLFNEERARSALAPEAHQRRQQPGQSANLKALHRDRR